MADSEMARGELGCSTAEKQVLVQTLLTGHTGPTGGNKNKSQGIPEMFRGEELGQMEVGGEDLDFCFY